MKKATRTPRRRQQTTETTTTAKPLKPRSEPPGADEKYVIGSIDTVKRGFLKEFCDFTKKKGTVDAETLVKEFSGRQIDGHKVDAARVARYIGNHH